MAQKGKTLKVAGLDNVATNSQGISVIDNSQRPVSKGLTEKEREARVVNKKIAMAANSFSSNEGLNLAPMTVGGGMSRTAYDGGDVSMGSGGNWYSPQLSTDFLEKPQNLRERRAWYRHFYNANEIVGAAVDLHSTIPLSKIKLLKPKCKNPHLAQYSYDFFSAMCEKLKMLKSLLEISHEYNLIGNCVTGDMKVRLPEGYVPIKDVEAGDLVLTHKGTFEEVEESISFKDKDILKVEVFGRSSSLKVTEEHPVEVLRDGAFVFVDAKDIKADDYIKQVAPMEVQDVDSVNYLSGQPIVETEDGYRYNVLIKRERNKQANEVRNKLLDFLSDLKEPTIKTRQELADEFGTTPAKLNAVILTLDGEIPYKFHVRKGAMDYQKGSQVQWQPISKETRDELITSGYSISRVSSFSSKKELEIDNDFLYMLGYWLGDGTLGRDKGRPNQYGRGVWYICFSKEESKDQLNRIRKILVNKLGEEHIRESEDKGMIYLHVKGDPAFIEWWSKNFGNTCKGSIPKKIPDWVKSLPKEKIKNLLSGLIDSDGCLTTNKSSRRFIQYNTSSETLARDVWETAMAKGFLVYEKASKDKGTLAKLPQGNYVDPDKFFVLTFLGEETCKSIEENCSKKFDAVDALYRIPQMSKELDGFYALKVKSIARVGVENVYNLQVAREHTFVVEGHSTHNCFIFCEDHDPYRDLPLESKNALKAKGKAQSDKLLKDFQIRDRDPNYTGWTKLIVLPPDQVKVTPIPFADYPLIEYMPDGSTKAAIERFEETHGEAFKNLSESSKPRIPEAIKSTLSEGGAIPLDQDPNEGSFVYHLSRKKSQYETMGVSILERCINTLLIRDKLRQAQTSIASRHMTPIRVVWAEQLSDYDVEELRIQVDMALMDPDYSIITNYQLNWEEIGATNRLLELSSEYEHQDQDLFAGLGVTREMMTGEATYSGSKMSLELLNTQYLLFRETLQEFVEKYLFEPVARRKGFVEVDMYGREKVVYPKFTFTRMSIRDNDAVFDQVFQLYNKGSIPIDTILEILGLDPDIITENLSKDMFTVKDASFNDLLRAVYQAAANEIPTKTNLTEKAAKALGLDMVEGDDAAAEGEGAGGLRFASQGVTAEQMDTIKELIKLSEENPEDTAKMVKYLKLQRDKRLQENQK